MAKLCQVIAVEKGVKSKAYDEVTRVHHALQKPALVSGLERVYRPRDEEGEQLPPESTKVQVIAEEVLAHTAATLTRLFDVTAAKEWGNTRASADIVVDGTTLLARVPVPYLLFLEKQLVDLTTFITKMPVLDPAEDWSADHTSGVWRSASAMTNRTRKVPRNHVKAEATDRHPAQVEVYHEDVTVGTWTTTKFSGAMPRTRVAELLERIHKLHDAVKFAREEANSAEVEDLRIGEAVFAYLLG
jgi:hypothetical protein